MCSVCVLRAKCMQVVNVRRRRRRNWWWYEQCDRVHLLLILPLCNAVSTVLFCVLAYDPMVRNSCVIIWISPRNVTTNTHPRRRKVALRMGCGLTFRLSNIIIVMEWRMSCNVRFGSFFGIYDRCRMGSKTLYIILSVTAVTTSLSLVPRPESDHSLSCLAVPGFIRHRCFSSAHFEGPHKCRHTAQITTKYTEHVRG